MVLYLIFIQKPDAMLLGHSRTIFLEHVKKEKMLKLIKLDTKILSDNIVSYDKGDQLNMVLEQIRDLVSKKFKVAADKVTLETRLREDLNVDSLDAVELVMELEDVFDIKIQDDEAQALKTVGDIVNFVSAKKA
jgi:acyl carrier protein